MTLEEFDSFKWRAGVFCFYEREQRKVAAVDFVERLIGICYDDLESPDADDISWVRCENVRIIE